MDKKSLSEVAPTSFKLGTAAAMKEPTKSAKSNALKMLRRI